MRTDGSDRRRLLSQSRPPLAWSPDRQKILFLDDHKERSTLSVVDLVSGRITPIVWDAAFHVLSGDWSPDGRQVVYAVEYLEGGSGSNGSPGGKYRIFIADADGSMARELPHHGSYPAWSPDGSRIAFGCYQGNSAVCTMRPDGSDLRGLSPVLQVPASWSPDGQWLASPQSGDRLVIVRADGSEHRTVGGPTAGLDRPAWTEDGQRLLYAAASIPSTAGTGCSRPRCDVPPGIYSVAVDGSDEVRITTGKYDARPVTPRA